MSKKKKSKLKLEELFSASSFGLCLYIKSDLHKILDNFYLNGFHIEETTSYDSDTVDMDMMNMNGLKTSGRAQMG